MDANTDTYDVIFAGGGASACVAAGRLAAADPKLKILLVEAGPHIKGIDRHIQPGHYLSHLAPGSKTTQNYVSRPSQALNGRSAVVPAGHCVGGGTSVNFMMYTRAAASDYDDWRDQYTNPGWGSEDIIPLICKAETYQAQPGAPKHGESGPVKVSYANHFTNVAQDFLSMAAQYDTTRGTTEDVNDMTNCNVFGRWPKYIDENTGRRSDIAHHYIYNQLENTNMTILDLCRVKRVLFEGTRAVGIEYVKEQDPAVEATTAESEMSQVFTAKASKLVVVSSGSCGSPAILERSGIGAADILKKNDIRCLVDLPGVGENYQDHHLVMIPYMAAPEADTYDPIFYQNQEALLSLGEEWAKGGYGRGLLGSNGIDAGIKMRPDEKDLKELGPSFSSRWESYFKDATDKPVVWVGPVAAYFGDYASVAPRKYFTMGYYSEYPMSKGSIHISSGDNVFAPLDFNAGFLDEYADVAVLRWAYKRGREFSRRMGVFRGEFAPGHPKFSSSSKAALAEADGPVSISTPDIVYSAEDDKAIDNHMRDVAQTTWHSIGTCAMKPREKGGVVDSALNVYGVQNLKVVDCSIAPANLGANIANTAIAIGEKAAVIIAGELGIKNV